jgi:hypothetical protein
MSELTPCNHCSLNRIKYHAKRDGKQVTTQWRNGWLEVYVHPIGIQITTDEDRDRYRQASMMALTDHCVC